VAKDKRAILVTGATRGLGKSIAIALASDGYMVWAGCRNPDDRQVVEAEARAQSLPIRAVTLDVTDERSVIDAAATIKTESSSLYGLVNNAGVTGRAFFEDYPDEHIRRIFEVNVFGVMSVTRRMLPLLRANGSGRIIVITSIGGRIGSNSVAPYVASKFALEGFAESISIELRPFDIFVSTVAPGIIRTDIWDEEHRILPEAKNPKSPYYRFFWRMEQEAERLLRSSRLTAEDVASCVVRLVDPAKRPRHRYIVGRRAALIVSLRRHLPGELFERIYFGEFVRRMTSNSQKDSDGPPSEKRIA
jgi:NAD(P)-dependent dehydrogenase (short-subunit alcohol dehydrogenase family)